MKTNKQLKTPKGRFSIKSSDHFKKEIMYSKQLITLFLLIGTSLLSAQDACPCCTPAHQQFDFWVGNWTVTDTTGKVVGSNTIIKQEDGCIIAEHWTGAGGTTGRSMNYFNRADSTWNQLWVDNGGNPLILKGRAGNQQMILKSDLQTGSKGRQYYNRVTWTLQEDGTVTQVWDLLSPQDSLIFNAFHGIYTKKDE